MTFFKKLTALFLILVFMSGFFYLPEQTVAAGDKIVITLDPGHGGPSDPGACRGQAAEKNLTLEVAYRLKALLEENGNFTVYLTRTGDTPLTKAQRLEIANNYNSDFLFSIHFDGNNNPYVNGCTVYTSVVPEFAPYDLAGMVASNLSALGFANNGVKQNADPECFWNSDKQWDIYDSSVGIMADYYSVISWGCKFGFPAIIAEHGYLSNASDASIILSDGALDRLAQADAAALISYFTDHTHTYTEQTVDYPSNCAVQGKSSAHCIYCRHRINVTLLPAEPENHYYYSDAIISQKVSCDTEESISYKCRISENFIHDGLYCEEHVLVNVLKPKTEHNYVVTYSQDVTHTVDGFTRYSCTNCTSNYTETVAAEGHSWVWKHTEPATCETNGAVTYVCPVCTEEYTEPIPSPGHSYYRIELLKDASCTESGLEKVKCSVCANETEREIPVLGHLRTVLEHVDSTCAVQGFDRCICYRCGLEYVEEIEMPSHEFEVTLDTDVTCTEDGKTVSKCTFCGEESVVIKEIASHRFEITEEILPKCEEDGYILSTCSVCGETTTEVLPASGHEWNEPFIVDGATAFTKGKLRTVCFVDENHFYDEDIPSGISGDSSFRSELVILGIFLMLSAAGAFLMKFGVIPFGFEKSTFDGEVTEADTSEFDKTDESVTDEIGAASERAEKTADSEKGEGDAEPESSESPESEDGEKEPAMAGKD